MRCFAVLALILGGCASSAAVPDTTGWRYEPHKLNSAQIDAIKREVPRHLKVPSSAKFESMRARKAHIGGGRISYQVCVELLAQAGHGGRMVRTRLVGAFPWNNPDRFDAQIIADGVSEPEYEAACRGMKTVLQVAATSTTKSSNSKRKSSKRIYAQPAGAKVDSGAINAKRWVLSNRLTRRTCPSRSCGDVGQLHFRSQVTVLEVKDGWARITRRYPASCRNGISEYVDKGNANCVSSNGITEGRFAEWVSMEFLTDKQPPDPAAGTSGREALIANSDDYRIHQRAFRGAMDRLVSDGRCSDNDFRENGGWTKAQGVNRDKPIYFIFCGGLRRSNRLYLDASSGEIAAR